MYSCVHVCKHESANTRLYERIHRHGTRIDVPRTHAHTHTQHAQDCTPLHYSARDGFKDAVEALLTKKADVNAKNVRLFNWGWVWWGVGV